MASPFILGNLDCECVNVSGQRFTPYIAFLNPIAFNTQWNQISLSQDSQTWNPPSNVDTAATRVAPYQPIANMGGNRIGFVGEPLYFDGSRSCMRHDLPIPQSLYTWSASGPATATFYANGTQMAFTWSAPGLYTVQLEVQDNAGTPTFAIRQVMIYQDRPSALSGIVSLSGLSGSLSNGGWSCQLTTVSSQVSLYPPDALPVGTYQPIVIMCETEYEVVPGVWRSRTIGPHGQFNPGYPYQDPRIFFDGYIQSGTVHQDVDKDTLSFSCSGIQMILQEAKVINTGYYNAAYTGMNGPVPLGLKPPSYRGNLVGNLMTTDVVQSLMQVHTNIARYHDLHMWNPNIPTNPYQVGNPIAYYNMIYTGISLNEGSIWSNMQSLLDNEYAQAYCERDGSIRVGPQINYRGNEYWSQPTLLGGTEATTLINFVSELGFDVGSDLSTMANNIPTALPALPMSVTFVHPWGHQPLPPQVEVAFQEQQSAARWAALQKLNGPPILCTFSDVPLYDTDVVPPDNTPLSPWIQYNWPQDLAVYPTAFDIQETYTGRTSLVKLIGTFASAQTIWSCWYPQSDFQVAPDGTSNTIASTLAAGDWYINDKIILPDATKAQNAVLLANWFWEMARRVYYAKNVAYNANISLGMFTACTLGDIVGITRQLNSLGPHWTAKPFYVTQIDYSLDLTARTWTTQLTCVEVTSALLTPIQKPPAVTPRA